MRSVAHPSAASPRPAPIGYASSPSSLRRNWHTEIDTLGHGGPEMFARPKANRWGGGWRRRAGRWRRQEGRWRRQEGRWRRREDQVARRCSGDEGELAYPRRETRRWETSGPRGCRTELAPTRSRYGRLAAHSWRRGRSPAAVRAYSAAGRGALGAETGAAASVTAASVTAASVAVAASTSASSASSA